MDKSLFLKKSMDFKSINYVRFIVMNFIRLMLIFAIFIGVLNERNLVLIIALLGFLVTFIPWMMQVFFNFTFRAGLEVVVVLFIYGLLVFGGVRNVFGDFVLINIFFKFGSSIALGLVGLTVLYVLDSEEIIDSNPLILSFFAFCFAFSLGGLWEIFEYSLDVLFGFGLQLNIGDIMNSLIINTLGSLVVCIGGYYHLKSGKQNFVSIFLSQIIRKNFKRFNSQKYFEYSSAIIRRLINSGELEKLEFKSTLRKNLHTGDFDKVISHSILKTIVAYLNSGGGTLIVGVDDCGKILGVELDEFISNDKLQLYFSGLIRNHIGTQYLHYIRYELFPIEDKHVLKIDCSPCKKRVFLKWNGNEEFYVRHGPATMCLSGNDLIDYVEHHFK
jgi:hypothetical protein